MIDAMLKLSLDEFGLEADEVLGDDVDFAAAENSVRHTKGVFTAPEGDPYDWWCYWSREAIDSEYSIPITLWIV